MPNDRARKIRLNMMAVQIAGEFPGNPADAQYVLERLRQILSENVFEEPLTRPPITDSASDALRGVREALMRYDAASYAVWLSRMGSGAQQCAGPTAAKAPNRHLSVVKDDRVS